MNGDMMKIGVPLLLAGSLIACDAGDPGAEDQAVPVDETPLAVTLDDETDTYGAVLQPVNAAYVQRTPGGDVRLTRTPDSLIIEVQATGLPEDMVHLQHLHGFEEGILEAQCPDPASDLNSDGVVDLMETEPRAGVTMIPFHADPTSMEIQAESYPRADAQGAYSYRQAVPLDPLVTAFEAAFGTRDLRLHDRVVFIHGVPSDTDLPGTAASLGDVPAHVTLPIACGELALLP